MDTNLQIQGIKSQIENMKLSIEIIENQNFISMNPMGSMSMSNPTGEQLLILSIQMFSTAIQTFNMGKNLSMDSQKYFDKLEDISKQINNIINSHQMELQQMFMQQQQQQQMMAQQQMMMMQQQQMMMMQQQMMTQQENKKISLSFKTTEGHKIILNVDANITLKELYEQFKQKIENEYGMKNRKFDFIYNANKIDKNSQIKIKDYFKKSLVINNPQAAIVVLFY